MVRRRIGRAVRRARAGLRGDARLSVRKKFFGQHARRDEQRAEKVEQKRDLERLKQNARNVQNAEELAKEPHSMVIHRGRVGRYLRKLEHDLRMVMEPYTASKLKTLKRNNLRDFIVNGTTLGVTHVIVLTRSEQSVTFRTIRAPQGPTLSFKVIGYTLSKDVVRSQRHALHFQQQFETPPLVVMNGFTDPTKKHLHLVQSFFQNMFPTFNIDEIKLSKVRRCVMINYSSDADTIDVRHYGIKAVPSGVSKSAKKLLQNKVPDLSKFKDISEYFLRPGQQSDSEFEGEQKEIELPQDLSTRGCRVGQKTNIRLIELGPRLTLSLTKIEEGIDEGEVLYHSYMKKTAKQLTQLRRCLSKRRKLKERRQKENEHRVIRRLKQKADREKEEEEIFEEEKERLIRKQKAATGDDEEAEAKDNFIPKEKLGKRGNEVQNTSESGEPPKKQLKHERKTSRSDGLTRAQRRELKRNKAVFLKKESQPRKKGIAVQH